MPQNQKSWVCEDRRTVRTHREILRCFREMLCELECQKLTVKELAERAGINRKTFYLHFPSIEELFDAELENIVEGYMQKMKELSVPVDIDEQTRVFFEYYCYQPPHVERLMCHPSYSYYCTRLHEKAIAQNQKRYHPNQERPMPEQNLIGTFLVSASLDLYRQWVKDGKVLPVERLVKIGCALIGKGYRGV